MTTILQLSDTHIVPEGKLVSGRLDTADALRRLIDRILGIRHQIGTIDALLISGDLSDDGSAESYAHLKRILAPLEVPLFVVPGNHDARAHMRMAFADDLPPDGPLNWERSLNDVHLIGLDTLVEGQGGGYLEKESLAFLGSVLARERTTPILLALHHPPFQSGIGFMDAIGLSNVGAFLRTIAGYKGELRLLCGHIHSMMIVQVAGRTAISSPSPCSTFAFDCSSDAPRGFMTQEDGFLIHRWNAGFQTIRIGPEAGSGPFPF